MKTGLFFSGQNHARNIFSLAAVALALVIRAQAQQTDTWNGGGTDNYWGTAANWGGVAPNVAGDNLIFSGSTKPINTNNLVGSIGWITLKPGTAMTIYGNALTNNSAFTNSTQNNTWNIPTTLGGNVNFNVASGLTLTLAGIVAGDINSGIMQTGPGTLALNNITNNTFAGPVVVSSGSTLQLGSLTASQNYNFPGSGLSVNNATLYFNGSSGGTVVHTYNFPNLTSPIASTNSTVKFNTSNATTKTVNAALDFEGINTIIYNAGSFSQNLNFNKPITGNGSLFFNFTGGGSGRVININTNGNNFTGSVSFNGASAATSTTTVNLKYSLGPVAYSISNVWNILVFTNALDNAASVSLIGPTANLKWAQSQYGWNNPAAALAVNAGTVIFGNTATTNGNISIGNLSGTGFAGVITNAGTNTTLFTVNQTSDAAFAGTIADNSSALLSFVKNGAAALTLAGTNTYAGPTTINAGSLVVNGPLASPMVTVNAGGALGGSGSVAGATIINAGGALNPAGSSPLTLNTLTLGVNPADNLTLTLNGDGTTIPSYVVAAAGLTNNGTVTVNVVGALPAITNTTFTLLTYPGTLSGTGTFVVGSLTSGALGYVTNNTAASAIQLVVTGSDYLLWKGSPANNWDLSGANNWILGSSGLPAAYQNYDLVTFDDSAANFNVNLATSVSPGGIIISNSVNNYVISGSGKISGTTTLAKNGAGLLTITTTNTFSSPTTISGGTVQLGDGTVNNGSVSSGIVDNGALIFANPGSQTYAGNISGSGTLAKQSAGTLTVGGNNTYDGATMISGGTFVANSTNALGSTVGTTTVSGGTLDVNGQNLGAEIVNIAGAGIGGNGAVINNGAVQLNALQNLALNSDATIGGSNRWDVRANGASANLNLNGSTLTKTGTNDVALVGVTVSDGDIVVNQGRFGLQLGTIFPAGLGQITVNSAGTLWVGDFGTPLQVSQPILLNGGLIQADSGTTATLGSPIALATNSTIYASVPITLSQPISGTGLLTKTGSSTLVLDNPTNTWIGGLTIAAGTLQLGNNDNNGSLPPTITVVTNNGLLAYSQTTDFIFTQPMVGTGGLEQAGPNTITITNVQSYTGGTVLQNGTLRLAAGDNTLSNATTLSFTGNSTLDMGTNSQTVSGLAMSGNITANVLSSGALNMNGVSPVQLGSANGTTPILNLTALNSFSYNGPLNEFSVGAPATGLAGQPASVSGAGTVNLALTNTIVANQFGIADLGGYGGNTSVGTVSLGAVNTINANTLAVGAAPNGWAATGTLNYQGAVANPMLVIRNAAGTGRANITIGLASVSDYAGGTGTVDLYTVGNGASTLDALIGTMILGQHNYPNVNQNQTATGRFAMGNGMLDATSIILGQKTYTGGRTGSSAFGQFVLLGGTVKVKTMLMGDQQFTNGPTVTGEFDLTSGTLQAGTINAGAGNATRTFNWTSGTIQNYDASTDLAINGLTLNLGGGPLAFNISAGRLGTIASSLNGGTPIVQTGNGTLVLSGNNSGYNGALANQAGTIYINSPLAGSVEAYANTVVGGSNSVSMVQVDNGGTLQAGDLTDAGTLTANTLNLGANSTDLTQSRLNLSAGGLIAANTLTVNGTNIVNITGTPVPVGTNNLILYSGAIGGNGFNGFKLGSLPGTMAGYLQNSSGAVQLVITSSVSTTPPNLAATVSGNTLNLSWPADHLGWRLQAQTNSLNTGLGTNWITVPGSAGVTSQSITIDPKAPTVFFHLVYP